MAGRRSIGDVTIAGLFFMTHAATYISMMPFRTLHAEMFGWKSVYGVCTYMQPDVTCGCSPARQ